MVALEAMEYMLPIITLNSSGGLKDLVTQNNVGIVCEERTISEEIFNLYNNMNQIQVFKSNCKNVKNYNKTKIFKEYKKILERVASK